VPLKLTWLSASEQLATLSLSEIGRHNAMKNSHGPLKSDKLRKPELQIIYCRQSPFDPSGVAYHTNFH